MDRYAAGLALNLEIDLLTDSGEAIEGVSFDFTVYDEEGVAAQTGSDSISGGSTAFTVPIDSSTNIMIGVDTVGARTISATVLDSAGASHVLTKTYLLDRSVILSVPEISGVTLAQASIIAETDVFMEMKEAWDYSDEADQKRALISGWNSICTMALVAFKRGAVIPEDLKDFANRKVGLNELTKAQFDLLPKPFLKALRAAQVTQACYLLGGDPTQERREAGLLSKTVGESSEMFRSKAPISGKLHPKAMGFLRSFINNEIKIAR